MTLTRHDIRQLANVHIQSIANMCLLLNEQDTKLFLEYCNSGLRSFEEGFNAEQDDAH